jgi:hypothetical protein
LPFAGLAVPLNAYAATFIRIHMKFAFLFSLVSLVSSGQVLAAEPMAIVIGTHAGPHVEGVPLLGIIGFIVAGALGVAWAAIALKSGRL